MSTIDLPASRRRTDMSHRILVWYSSGAASAVAAKISVGAWGDAHDVQILKCDTSKSEHPDNARFDRDVERWIGREIVYLRSEYATIEECWDGERYIVGQYGASCTRVMKREVREKFQLPEDEHVFGFTADKKERARHALFCEKRPEVIVRDPLQAITKTDCYNILSAAGIRLPAMYTLGYDHNNCIGCCKGGKGYWNRIRIDFPDVFAARAKQFRELGVQLNSGGELYWLDELKPDEGRDMPEQDIECGIFCDQFNRLVELTTSAVK